MGVTTRSSQTPTKSTKSSEEDDEQFIVQKRPINQSSSSGEEECDSEATHSNSKKDSDADSGESETGEDVAQNESRNDIIEGNEDEDENAEEDNEEEEEYEEEDEEEENEEERQKTPKLQSLNIGLKASMEYLFVPMLSSPDHWTLLYLDLHDLKWHHYNSLESNAKSRNMHKAAAERFKKYLTSVLKPIIAKHRGVGVRKVPISQDLVLDDGLFQQNPIDCGLYVCNYIKHVLMGNNQNWKHKEVHNMRREWVKALLTTRSHSWDPNNYHLDEELFAFDNVPKTASGHLACSKQIEEPEVDSHVG